MGFFKNKLKVADAFGIPLEALDTTTVNDHFTKKQIQKVEVEVVEGSAGRLRIEPQPSNIFPQHIGVGYKFYLDDVEVKNVRCCTLRICATEAVMATLEVFV